MRYEGRVFLLFLDGLFSFVEDRVDFVKSQLLGEKHFKVELPSGIVVKTTIRKSGEKKCFSLRRNQRVFERMSWGDTRYSVTFTLKKTSFFSVNSKSEWEEISDFQKKQCRGDLPAGWKFDHAKNRIFYWRDGETFSLPVSEILKINKILNEYNTKEI